jgi:hypothetical protein
MHSRQIAVTRSMRGLEVHRQGRTQVGEARMHLAADRPAVGAGNLVGRQQARFRLQFVQIFADRQGVPDLDRAMLQAGHEEGRRQQQKLCPRGRIVERGDLFVELQPGHFAQQPAAQGPRGIVLATDGE